MIRLTRKTTFTTVTLFLLLTACINKPVDVLVSADGTVLTGTLQSIASGTAVFESGRVDVPDIGRIWRLDGTTQSGPVVASDGIFSIGTFSASSDSLYLIVWGNPDLNQESFSVDAALGWLDTGIELNQGAILSLHGTGTVVSETGTSTPDGQEKFSSSVSLVPGATSGQLVFKVGDAGQPVAAGSSWIGESPNSGALMLAVNVPLEGSLEARGVYSVVVNAAVIAGQAGTVVFYPAGR